MQKGINACSRCGQALNLVDEPYSEYQSIRDKNNNELCPRCYQELCDQSYQD